MINETNSNIPQCIPGPGVECNYAAMLHKWKEQIKLGQLSLNIPYTEDLLILPYDKEGKCIFHSKDIKWKEKNNFLKRLKVLIGLLEADPEMYYIGLDGVVFVGDTSTGTPKTISEYNKDGTLKKKYTRKNRNIDFRNQVFNKAISALDAIFWDHVDFSGVIFTDRVTLSNVTFKIGATFDNAVFKEAIYFSDSVFDIFANFKKTEFGFCSELEPSTSFCQVAFNCEPSFNEAVFNGPCSFKNAQFHPKSRQPGDTKFQGAIFKKKVSFQNAIFNCGADFQDVIFKEDCEFIDTSFYNKKYLLFNGIQVDGSLVFKGNSQNKLFKHTVLMEIDSERISGKISFEDVNLSYMVSEHLHYLEKLSREKDRKVLIGQGCLKYRHTTSPKTIYLDKHHHNFIMEITTTFTNYFEAYNGFNIGVEIVEKSETKITLVYFTDEDIDEGTWYKRLQKTENAMWDLLYRVPSQETAQAKAIGTNDSHATTSTPVNTINILDLNINLLGIFLKIGIRIKKGWFKSKKSVEALFDSINFSKTTRFNANDLPMIIQNNFIHLQQKITGPGNTQEINIYNQLEEKTPSTKSLKKKRILFLSANPKNTTRLNLDEEFREIEEALKRSKKRDRYDAKAILALRFEDLRRALLENEPYIVHFAGHGTHSGLMILDETRFPEIISSEVVSQLFKSKSHQTHQTKCVILSACYSAEQAKLIGKFIPFVIGIKNDIEDNASIEFTRGFYDAIGAGADVEQAVELGRISMIQKFPNQETPLIIVKKET